MTIYGSNLVVCLDISAQAPQIFFASTVTNTCLTLTARELRSGLRDWLDWLCPGRMIT